MGHIFIKLVVWTGLIILSVYILQLFGVETASIISLSYLVIAGVWMFQRDRMRYHYLDKIEEIEKERDALKKENHKLTFKTERLEKELDIAKNGEFEEIIYDN